MEEREERKSYDELTEGNDSRETYLFDHWLLTATRSIVFRRDRTIAREELTDHFRQRMEDFVCRGLSWKEAQKKAVEALGDPKETGRLLARVHQPILSWCLRLARILLILLILAASISWLANLSPRRGKQDDAYYECVLARREGASEDKWQLGGFNVKLGAAQQSMYRAEWYHDNDGTPTLTQIGYNYELRLKLDFSAAPWYSPDSSALEKSVSIVDDHGRVYRSYQYTRDEDLYDEDKIPRQFYFNGSDFFLSLAENVEWVDLIYEGDAGKRTMHITFAPWETMESKNFPPLRDEAEQVEKLKGSEWDSDELNRGEIVSVRELTVSGEPEDGSLRVPWARVVRLGPPENWYWDSDRYLVEFIAVTRGSPWEILPVSKYRSEIYHISFEMTADGAPVYRNDTTFKSTLSFRDAFVSRNCFLCETEAEVYELTYPGPTGPVTLTLTVGEEAAP